MSTIKKKLFDAFIAELSKAPELDASKIDRIKALLQSDKKPKPDDFVQVFTDAHGGDIK